ncbi:MAG TPA: phosphoribosylanthranilate isomerase [Longimicrobiales bacterium]
MKIKICGVCRPEDAAAAQAAAVDYLGVILAHRGPRQQTVETARRIFDAAPDLWHVGVFADQTMKDVAALAELLRLDVIQLHGSENAQLVNELECETDCAIWKSVSLTSPDDLRNAIDLFADDVDALLLDSAAGGSGQRFDWSLADQARALLPAHVQLVIAGGLNAENVGEAVSLLSPDVVDVASGVEEELGVKSAQKIAAFVRSARA